MKRISLLATLAVTVVLSSCGDKKKDPAPKTKAEMLVANDWVISGATATISGQSVDVFNGASSWYDACEKDNYYHFTSPSAYELKEGSNVCSPSGAETGTWSLNAEGTKLTLTAAGSTADVYDVVELSGTTMKLSGTEDFLGTRVTFTQTYSKK